MSYAILIDTPEGGNAVVICASRPRAEAVREVLESKGTETRGIVPVLTVAYAVTQNDPEA